MNKKRSKTILYAISEIKREKKKEETAGLY